MDSFDMFPQADDYADVYERDDDWGDYWADDRDDDERDYEPDVDDDFPMYLEYEGPFGLSGYDEY